MSDQKKDATVSPDNNAMPGEPAKDEITTLNNAMPSEPAKDEITTLNNAMPAGPAVLDLDDK